MLQPSGVLGSTGTVWSMTRAYPITLGFLLVLSAACATEVKVPSSPAANLRPTPLGHG